MTYPQDLEQKLGFDQIRGILKNFCLCPLGQKQVDALCFSSDMMEIEIVLRRSLEMRDILQKADPFPFSNYFDPEELIQTISVEGGFLEEDSFQSIILSLLSVFEAKEFLSKSSEQYPFLFYLSQQVLLPAQVLREIRSKFDENGKIKDNATPELNRIRKKLTDERSRIRRMVEQVYRSAASQGWVPKGVLPTIRDGRVVIPLLAEHKRKVKGFIMDASATGQTVYLEPAEVLEANNELRDLELAARKEVVKILKDLTTLLRLHSGHFKSAYHFLGLLDFNRAKAKISINLGAGLPHLVPQPELNWVNARHPLLFLSLKGKRPVVPLNIALSTTDRFLLVSGPNAGGKSVCLKTVGLVQYMLQCGLLVPLQEQSTMGIFKKMFIDIGDQQSIENDLSTYSSHLKNMNYFLTNGDESSLILMDELGSGTDPNFGGGIAQAILSKLIVKKAWGVATTHYYSLKLFAGNTPGVLNGAMLFSTQKLEPLFILEIGKPGSSFALEIARKTGLSAETIHEAETIIGEDLTGLETLMKSVADDKLSNTRKTVELNQREKELSEKVARYEKLAGELESQKKEIINKAKSEASGLLRKTNREIEKTIRHIQENKADKKETRKVRDALKGLEEKVKIVRPEKKSQKEDLQAGDKVRIPGQEVSGTLLQINGSSAVVQFGDLRSHVRVDQLIRSDQAEPAVITKARSFGLDIYKKQSLFESTLDVRGKRVGEVIPELTRFLDDAVLLGQGQVKILHGKGEGVLRKVVRELLKKTKGVASFADEHVERGGAGVTVVVLK